MGMEKKRLVKDESGGVFQLFAGDRLYWACSTLCQWWSCPLLVAASKLLPSGLKATAVMVGMPCFLDAEKGLSAAMGW
jgi:hypothetical protein